MTYTRPMQLRLLTKHYLLASFPLLGLLALLFDLHGTEDQILWVFRVHKDVHPLVKQAMYVVSNWGNIAMYFVWVVLLFRGWRYGNKALKRYALVFFTAQLCIGLILVSTVKFMLGRPRPGAFEVVFQFFSTDPYFHSLPSGHTTEITGSCLALAFWLRRWWASLCLGLVLAAVGFSRIYLFEHFPSDVFFGWLFGSLTGLAACTFGLTKDTPHNG